MTERDHFAAAALTGLIANGEYSVESTPTLAWRMADAMLREREKTNHDAAPTARGDARECAAPVTVGGTSVGVSAAGAESGSTPDAQGFGRSKNSPCQPFDSAPTTDQERFVRFQSAVMNWISEATGFLHDDVLRTDDARDVITDACSRCWDAFDRISYPTTNHDAAPAARASLPTADHAVRRGCESGCGTGGTHRSVEESSRPRRAHNPEIAGANPAAPINDSATGELGGGVGLSPDSRPGQINRTPECESPRRECGESLLRDVPQLDNSRAAGGPEHRISEAEIDALECVVEDGRIVGMSVYGRLRSLLVRLRPEWEDESDRSQPVKGCVSDRSKPISDERLAALEELSAMDQELELKHGIEGNPMIKAQRSNESIRK